MKGRKRKVERNLKGLEYKNFVQISVVQKILIWDIKLKNNVVFVVKEELSLCIEKKHLNIVQWNAMENHY